VRRSYRPSSNDLTAIQEATELPNQSIQQNLCIICKMMNNIVIVFLISFIALVQSFQRISIHSSVRFALQARVRRGEVEANTPTTPKYVHGVDIPDEVLQHQAIYDMILVERINAPLATSSGIILPLIEGKDQKKIGIVLSMAQEYGLESEQGRIQDMNEIAPYSIGDYVYVKVSEHS
jgi:co-chaperonin GroES (HSP10)